jgi:Ni2+-binding GTPase involved in maturation of urease and hydrogenase
VADTTKIRESRSSAPQAISEIDILVGDLATENDAVRLARRQAPAKQITTGTLCHLEAAMVRTRWKSGISINAISFLSKMWEPGMSFVLRSG